MHMNTGHICSGKHIIIINMYRANERQYSYKIQQHTHIQKSSWSLILNILAPQWSVSFSLIGVPVRKPPPGSPETQQTPGYPPQLQNYGPLSLHQNYPVSEWERERVCVCVCEWVMCVWVWVRVCVCVCVIVTSGIMCVVDYKTYHSPSGVARVLSTLETKQKKYYNTHKIHQ